MDVAKYFQDDGSELIRDRCEDRHIYIFAFFDRCSQEYNLENANLRTIHLVIEVILQVDLILH